MSWSALTITRDDVDALEGQTFRDINITSGTTVLGIDQKDNLVLNKAKQQLEADSVDKLRHLINDGTYATETALLNAIEEVDNSDLLKDLLTYRFLELWFYQDASHADSKAMMSSRKYNAMYVHYLDINLQRLAGALASPKAIKRYTMRSAYAGN